jgi:cholesterol transport system auxiliary component
VTVFPKQAPVQLYRFGGAFAPAQNAPAGPAFMVEVLPINFSADAAGDRILTVTGAEAAYIGNARWVTSATNLFEQALTNAFEADAGPARLMSRGEPVRPDLYLKLDVRRFDANYLQGAGGAPTVEVAVDAALSAPASRMISAERLFSATVPADANRGGRIAAAFDQAVTSVLQPLVKWVDAKGAG